MSKHDSSAPLTQVRRRDRAVEDEGWIRDFLHNAPFAALATAVNGQPFINSNIFVYDQKKHAIYLHTARKGRTRTNLEHNQRVCLSVSEMGRLLPADVALEFSVEYSGVTVFGTAAIVADPAEARQALQQLLDKYFPQLQPGKHYRPVIAKELERTSVYRIDIEQWSGKQKKADDDFPGAFFYGERLGGV
ncbi:MAG: pyridoxamine 5'-phosphate oxidase family protein [bacterium]